MSKKANPTLIGVFVIGAIALLVSGAMLFGGGEFFAEKRRLVAYFPESVKGLRNGANVIFRGVRVGYVEDIQLQGDVETLETQVQVIMRIFPEQYDVTGKKGAISDVVDGEELINAGFKAQLGVESFVTGQLLIELDFHPETEVVYRGNAATPYAEVPTVPNNIQQLVDKAQRFIADIQEGIDFKQLSENLQDALKGIDELVNSQDLRQVLAGLNKAVNSDDTQQLSARLGDTLEVASDALAAVEKLAFNAESDIGPLADQLQSAVAKLELTLDSGRLTQAEVWVGNSSIGFNVRASDEAQRYLVRLSMLYAWWEAGGYEIRGIDADRVLETRLLRAD